MRKSILSSVIVLRTTTSIAYPYGIFTDEHKKTDPFAPANRSKGEKKRNKSARYVK
ncbi:MAG TPA: hypothetical protein PLZ58_04030 [Candidatus Saccharibacteria bacterium]|nr:hypothetical protein [Candidatus Saccharibacteria bacterium]